MSFNFFGFGRKRTTRRRKVGRKGSKKAVSRTLLSLCKKYHVKCTKKVGSRRVRKSSAVIKKQLARKIRSLIKRASKFGSRKTHFGVKHRHAAHRKVRSMSSVPVAPTRLTRGQRIMAHIRKRRGVYGALAGAALTGAALAGARRAGYITLGGTGKASRQAGAARDYAKGRVDAAKAYMAARRAAPAAFGKRRRVRYRKYHFGSNPPLSNSMGYEFCSNGGGVLGANSTGLFPSPCMNATTMGGAMMGSSPKAAFGRRRRYRRKGVKKAGRPRRVGRPRKVSRKRRVTRRRM